MLRKNQGKVKERSRKGQAKEHRRHRHMLSMRVIHFVVVDKTLQFLNLAMTTNLDDLSAESDQALAVERDLEVLASVSAFVLRLAFVLLFFAVRCFASPQGHFASLCT